MDSPTNPPSERVSADALAPVPVGPSTFEWHQGLIEDVDAILWEAEPPPSLRYTFVSPQAERILGYPLQQWLFEGDFWQNRLHPEDRDRALGCRREVAEDGRSRRFDYRLVRRDGGIAWIDELAHLARDPERGTTCLRGVMIDVTARVEAERLVLELQRESDALRRADRERERVSDLVQAVDSVIWEAEADPWRFTFMLGRVEDILGLPADRLLADPSSWSDSVDPEDRPRWLEFSRSVHGTTTPQSIEYRIIRPGERRTVWLRTIVRALPDGADSPSRCRGITVEITALKRAEEALARSERRFRTLANSIPQLAWIADRNGSITWYNERWFDFTGRTFEETRGWGWRRLVHPDQRHRVHESLRRSVEAGEIWEQTFRIRSRTGEFRWALGRARPVAQDSGEIDNWFGTFTDITELVATEDALRQSEARLRRAMAIDSVAIAYFSRFGEITDANDAFLRLSGLSRADVEAARVRWEELLPREWLLQHAWVPEEFNATGRTAPFEIELFRKDGTRWWALVASAAIDEREGVAFLVDISRQKQAEERLWYKEQRERLLSRVGEMLAGSRDPREVLDDITGLIVPRFADLGVLDVVEPDGRLTRYGWRDTIARISPDDLYSRLVPDDSGHLVEQVIRTGTPLFVRELDEQWIRSARLRPRDLDFIREFGVHSLISAPYSANGDLTVVLTIGTTDSSRRFVDADLEVAGAIARRIAMALQKAALYAKVQKAAHQREELSSIVAHDLRDPVSTIKMVTDLLLDTEVGDAKRRQHLEIVRRSAERMLILLEDLLDFAQIDAGRLVVNAQPEPIDAILRDALDSLHIRAAELGIQLETDIEEECPPVMVDRSRLLQVLSNLVGNAFKFTPSGGTITVRARRLNGDVRVDVIDTGSGIPQDALPHLFDRFWQAEQAARAGAGLGLAIVKGIIEAHGGRIWVDSREGSGAVFAFTLPIAGDARKDSDPNGSSDAGEPRSMGS